MEFPFKCAIMWYHLLPPGAPTITVEPVETVVDAGTTVVMNCQAEGEPTPMMEWSRQGRPLLGINRFSTLSNGSLRISSAQKEDTAEYECVARNLLGSVLVRVTLTVRGEFHYGSFSLQRISESVSILDCYKPGKQMMLKWISLFFSTRGLLRVGRVGSLQCVLWRRGSEEAEAL